jgi:hypothetical protein
MLLCVTASLTAILAIEPPQGDPPVQRPKSVQTTTSAAPAENNPPLFPEAEPPATDPVAEPPEAEQPAPEQTDPAVPAPDSPQPEATEPPAKEPEIANLLESDEPADLGRPVVAPASPSRERVDHSERLRGYYASVYRPRENPARVWFAARGSYSLTGSNESVGGGRMGVATIEAGQTWNWLGYGLGLTVMGGSLTFGEAGTAGGGPGISKQSGVLVGGGPSLGLGRLALLGRGFVDFRVGYNFFYAPIRSAFAGQADPADASPHGPKAHIDVGLLMHDSESRRFRHGFGATLGWQMLVHSFTGQYPRLNAFNVGVAYFFG